MTFRRNADSRSNMPAEPQQTTQERRHRAVRKILIEWFDRCRRELPWRTDRTSYRVWVAEVMLQQTRIAVVLPAFERFIARFPDVAGLATSSEDDVLCHWSGLGYYGRARSLHRAARLLHAQGAVDFPRDRDAALTLPGVGAYTAAAVLSIAYGRPLAAVDGNVVRVVSRLECIGEPSDRPRVYHDVANRLLARDRPGDWNEAIMELGQTVCLPKAPRCEACPIAASCLACRTGRTNDFPPRRERRKPELITVCLLLAHDGSGHVVLERDVFPHQRNMWLPIIRSNERWGKTCRLIGTFQHSILHRRLTVQAYEHRSTVAQLREMACKAGSGTRMVASYDQIRSLGRSGLLAKSLRMIGFDFS